MPFTVEQFFEVFADYNTTIFPFQIILVLLGMLFTFYLSSGNSKRANWTGYFLSFIWVWVGVVYHIIFFSSINLPAYGFGAIFIIQGILFLIETNKGELKFLYKDVLQHKIGAFLILFSLLLYPIIAYFLKYDYTKVITVGLPCPTTIMTFGFLLISIRLPKYLLIFPSIWAIIGTWAAIDFGVYQDYVMTFSALIGIYFLGGNRNGKSLNKKNEYGTQQRV